jgi:hypothetical protein
MKITVRAAYDVLRGNPFSKHGEFDFNFLEGFGNGHDFNLEPVGVQVRPLSASTLEIDAQKVDFIVEMKGFDPNRDLKLDLRRKSA